MRCRRALGTVLLLMLSGAAIAEDGLDDGFLEFLASLVPATSATADGADADWLGPDDMVTGDEALEESPRASQSDRGDRESKR